MRFRQRLVRTAAATAALIAAVAVPVLEAKTLRYAFQGDLNSLDGYTLNEGFTLGAINNVMEGLTRRDRHLNNIPGLAERWEVRDNGLTWRFYLRKGVKFHEGQDFTADDVIFSLQRVKSQHSQLKTRVPADMEAKKIDDHTVDFLLKRPNPILHAEWHTWFIFSKSWAEANGAVEVQSATATSLSPGALKVNGTGPFKIEKHEPGNTTIFKPNPAWWGKPEHNLTEVIFRTIKSDATRVAALLSGEIDMMDPVPPQDFDRINANAGTEVLVGPELRTIFLNMDSFRPELLYSNVKGKNPFKDVRVRKAFYQAIDIDAIKTKIMRNMSVPSALIIAPSLVRGGDQFKRYPYDVAAAKKLMTEAGYPNGFELEMDCPNDRYVNDEAICQATVAMLARIDVKVKLNAMPKARYFEKAGPTKKYDSSFNMFGWTPGSLDSLNMFVNVAGCRDADGKGSPFNYGGWCDPRVTALAEKIAVEIDEAKRDAFIIDAYKIIHDEVGILPLHQQSLAWGVSKKVKMVQRADNLILLHWVQKQD
jgi:peptide/nickel transport system substrate-binding protein